MQITFTNILLTDLVNAISKLCKRISFHEHFNDMYLCCFFQAMDLFDLGEGYDSLIEGMSRIKCPALVKIFYNLSVKHNECLILAD